MKNIIKSRRILTILCLSIILVLSIILTVKIVDINQKWTDSQKIELKDCKINGYIKKEDFFVNQIGDANIQLPELNQFVGGLTLNFLFPVEKPLNITLYYQEEDHGYSEEYTESVNLRQNEKSISLLLGKEIVTCRIDIGTNIDEFFALENIIINDQNSKSLKIFEIVIASFFFVFLIIGIYLLMAFSFTIEKMFAVFIMCIGMFYLVIITPLSPPDEPHHYQSAYQLSNFLLFQWNNNDTGNSADFDYENLTDYNISNGYLKIFEEITISAQNGNRIEIPKPRKLDYFVEYLPQALGITLARITNQNFIITFLIGRFFNLVFFTICIYFSIKQIPKFKMLIGIIGILPMTIQQAASFSYDGFINGVSIFLIASLLKAIYETGPISKMDIYSILISGILLTPTKVVYCVILLLVILIPKERFSSKKERFLKIFLIWGSCIIILFLFRLDDLLNRSLGNALNWEGNYNYSLDYIFKYPVDTIKIFLKTFITNWKDYLYTCIGGRLSGLSLEIPNMIVNLFIALLCISVLNDFDSKYKLSVSMRCMFLFIVFGVVVLTMLSMFTGYTSVGRNIIQGVQGRYFIPILPLLVISLNNQVVVLKKNIEKIEMIALLVLHGGVINQVLNYTI